MTLTEDDIQKIDTMIKDFVFQAFESHARYSEMKERHPSGYYVKECSAMKEDSSIVHIEKSYLQQLQHKAENGIPIGFVAIPRQQYNEWKEKAENWYDLIERFQFSPPDNILYTITAWREKAKKVDDWEDKGQYMLIKTDEFHKAQEWKEKASNWDELTDAYGVDPEAYISELKEKAKNWDEHERDSPNTIHLNMDHWKELKEKAKKYDEFKPGTTFILESRLFEYMEKAKKWDSLCINVNFARNDTRQIDTKDLIFEWKEKVEKYDELKRCEEINSKNYSEMVERLVKAEDKARKWDEYVKGEHRSDACLEGLYKERLDKINTIVNESTTE